MKQIKFRTHLKNVFWPNIFVGAELKILDIQQYASGSKLGSAAILNQNPIFEIGSNYHYSLISSVWQDGRRRIRLSYNFRELWF